MNSSRAPALIAGAALVAAVVVFFILRDSDDGDDTAATGTTVAETTTAAEPDSGGEGTKPEEPKPEERKPEIETIVLSDGQPVDGVAELAFAEGEAIRFAVESDIADEIHMHGYDVSEEVEAGGTVKFDVPATIPGVFEVESHHGAAQIAEITVNPA